MEQVQEHSSVYLKTSFSCCQSRAVILNAVVVCKYLSQACKERELWEEYRHWHLTSLSELNLDYTQVELIYRVATGRLIIWITPQSTVLLF